MQNHPSHCALVSRNPAGSTVEKIQCHPPRRRVEKIRESVRMAACPTCGLFWIFFFFLNRLANKSENNSCPFVRWCWFCARPHAVSSQKRTTTFECAEGKKCDLQTSFCSSGKRSGELLFFEGPSKRRRLLWLHADPTIISLLFGKCCREKKWPRHWFIIKSIEIYGTGVGKRGTFFEKPCCCNTKFLFVTSLGVEIRNL